MNMLRVFVIASIFSFTKGLRLPQNHTAVLISKYAKVAKWGASENSTNQETSGRSYTSIWTPRSNSNSDSASNQVVYQYPVYRKQSEKGDNEVEIVPGIGEVIQERFQVRPYFPYSSKIKDSAISYLPPSSPPAPAPTPPPVRQDSPPVVAPPAAPPLQIAPPTFPASDFNAAPSVSSPRPPSNLYDSPFSSYNPPSAVNSDVNQDVYPPIAPSSQTNDNGDSFSSNGDSYASAPLTDNGPYNYQLAPKPPMAPSGDTKDNSNNFYDEARPPSDSYGPSNQAPSEPNNHHGDGPPKHPPKSINDVYYPPGFPKDQVPGSYGGHDVPMMDMAPQDDQKGHDDMDMVPPPEDHFPKYLYDDHHYDHHVYEEVPHTSPAPEKKRVSTTNYSYYYLGRKLWYIPLYFSIYFMVYVTALIIKSIARHKVTLRNDWITANSRTSRDITFKHIEAIDEVHRNITTAIDKADKIYSGLAM